MAKISNSTEKKSNVIGMAMVTPATVKGNAANLQTIQESGSTTSPRRTLFQGNGGAEVTPVGTDKNITMAWIPHGSPAIPTSGMKRKVSVVTPSSSTETRDDDSVSGIPNQTPPPTAKRRLLFGRYVELVQCAPNVDSVYKIVHKLTGNIGGNGYSGPIYGELTKHSMQKMIDLMVKHTGFSSSSRFIDVGSGIGKPNLHVAQYPGVEFSCGVEMEHNRWSLGMTCLKACLNAAMQEQEEETGTVGSSLLEGNTMFLHNNILEATTFDPFTHVYMFSIGFPPDLWIRLSKMWNRSDTGSCQYLICYASPRDVIDCYQFDAELLTQVSTSMHGSKESHMGYIYGRTTPKKASRGKKSSNQSSVACDPLFKPAYKLVKKGLVALEREVDRQVEEEMGGSQRITRSRQKIQFSKS
mmetsp:Transcript_21589/g.47819  ORF Transcript_21589/g.47819 Transcript_21589/m.47819 type:complete len:412 (+) Transcript_21589:88-1323(+)